MIRRYIIWRNNTFTGNRCKGASSFMRTDRDLDPEYRVARPGIDFDGPTVTFGDDAAGDVQTEGGIFRRVLGREKSLERTGRHVRRHPAAGVGDLDDYAVVLGASRQPKRSLAIHCLDGV